MLRNAQASAGAFSALALCSKYIMLYLTVHSRKSEKKRPAMQIETIDGLLRAMLCESCALGIVPIEASYQLHPSEEHFVSDAVEKRRAEFAAGRVAARLALRELGIPDQPIPRAEDRSPVWPKSIKGSITHALGIAGAVVTQDPQIAGLGLDIEGSTPMTDRVRRHILTDAEMRSFNHTPTIAGLPRCKLTFVAKEALFKAVYPTKRAFFGFRDAEIDMSPGGTWQAQLIDAHSVLPEGTCLSEGRWAATSDLVIATLTVEGIRPL